MGRDLKVARLIKDLQAQKQEAGKETKKGEFQRMIRKNTALVLCILITLFVPFLSKANATSPPKDQVPASQTLGLNIEFDGGMLSVDIKDIDVRVIFKALEEKGNIEIFNKKIVPDRKITLKFSELKTEEGMKKLMHACGVKNYATIFTKEPEAGEPRVAKLILVKAGIGPVAEVEKKAEAPEAILPAPDERKIEVTGVSEKEIEKAERESLVKTIMPMLEGADDETRQDIIKEIMEGELTVLDED